MIEGIGAAIFVQVILVQTENRTRFTDTPWVIYLSIAATLMVAGTIAGPISGGAINPALGFGINIAMWIDSTNPASMNNVWIYLVMPMVGSAASVIFFEGYFKLSHPKTEEERNEERKAFLRNQGYVPEKMTPEEVRDTFRRTMEEAITGSINRARSTVTEG